jgi:alkylhydroperoxidase/carboxymuconolactone decarboxylase family protein YurZ
MTNPAPFNWQEALDNNVPDLMKYVTPLRQETGADGALPAKTKTLMMMLGDALLGHAEGVANIARGARAMGVTEEEIKETVAIAYIMGGLPCLITASNAFRK